MFGFACRSVYAHCPWPWKTTGGGPAGGAPPRVPRGLLGGQTVVLLTVWASALVCGVALAGPPDGAARDPAPAVPATTQDEVPAASVTIEAVPSPTDPAEAGSDAAAADGESAGAFGVIDCGRIGEPRYRAELELAGIDPESIDCFETE
jgi:hypothetical protein